MRALLMILYGQMTQLTMIRLPAQLMICAYSESHKRIRSCLMSFRVSLQKRKSPRHSASRLTLHSDTSSSAINLPEVWNDCQQTLLMKSAQGHTHQPST